MRDFLLEIAVARRDDPNVHADVRQAADALEGLLLEEAEELGLEARRHLPDFVEEDGAAVGGFEQAPFLLPCVGEGAALVAEQLAFEQLLGERRTW